MSNITTSQTIGPFSHEAWKWAAELSSTASETLTISGVIYDGDGLVISDAQLESWQPAAAVLESAMAIPGFRRVPSGAQGEFSFSLSKVAQQAGEPIAFITVFARGLVKHQFTAVFLEDDPALQRSPILEQVPGPRRATLIGTKTGPDQYRWDIWMQGEKETAFFDYV